MGVTAALKKVDPDVELRRAEVVGPQVGQELTHQGFKAMLLAFLLIGIYIRFRFEWKSAAARSSRRCTTLVIVRAASQ